MASGTAPHRHSVGLAPLPTPAGRVGLDRGREARAAASSPARYAVAIPGDLRVDRHELRPEPVAVHVHRGEPGRGQGGGRVAAQAAALERPTHADRSTRCAAAGVVPGAAAACSMSTSRPPGCRIRRTSASAAAGSATVLTHERAHSGVDAACRQTGVLGPDGPQVQLMPCRRAPRRSAACMWTFGSTATIRVPGR